MKTACKRLQEVAKIDAIKAIDQIETWFEETAHDGEVVLKAIETGWGKEYPIGNISKVITSKIELIKVKTSWQFDGHAYDEDPQFQALARNDQGVVFSFLKNSDPQPWLMKHIKNHNMQAFNFLKLGAFT